MSLIAKTNILSSFPETSTNLMINLFCFAEIVTGMKFTNDCKHLISVSGDR